LALEAIKMPAEAPKLFGAIIYTAFALGTRIKASKDENETV
jgi:hypothetical protein